MNMKIIIKYQNLWTLYKWHKDVKKIKYPDRFFKGYSFLTPKKKNSKTRNLIASILKQLRTLHPYKIKDYSEAEKLYKEYFTLENHIPSLSSVKVGQFVRRFRNEYAVRGQQFCEYFITFSSGDLEVLEVTEVSDSGSFKLSNISDDSWCDTLDEGYLTGFLFATKEEIKGFKNRQKEYKSLEKQIELKQKEVSKLREMQNKL